MFAGVARYVCRPQPHVVARMEAEIVAAMKACGASGFVNNEMRACEQAVSQKTKKVPSLIASPRATTLTTICGNDAKLTRMLKRHLDASRCALTRTKGIDLDTLLRRDHAIPLNDFLTLSTVNRKILLLDSLKRHNADVDIEEPLDEEKGELSAGGERVSLSGSQRHDLILERGRSLLLELHRKKSPAM